MNEEENPFPEPVELEITDSIDLHSFQPRDIRAVVEAYLFEAFKKQFPIVRIIHGKGIGQLRQTVHQLLERHPDVDSFNLAPEHFGGWGATIVHLQPPSPKP